MSMPRARLAHAAPAESRARTRPAWKSSLHRIAAALAAVALGAGLALVGAAAPASAHHNTIKATADCDTATGKADLTWSVTNSEKLTETITWSSDESVVPKDTTLGDRETRQFTQSGVGPGTYSLELKGKWSNGEKSTDKGSITVKADLCDDGDDEKITYCHSGNGKQYSKIETSVSAFYKSGHINHDDDIFPAFSFWKDGKLIQVAAQGDQGLLKYKDCTKPKPEDIDVPAKPTSVDDCGTANDRVVQPAAIEGVVWTIGEIVDGKATVTATALEGYEFDNGKTKVTWEYTFTDKPCPVNLVGAPTFGDSCGLGNEQLVLPVDTESADWQSVREGDTITVTVAPKPGYVFTGDPQTEWAFSVNDEPCPPGVVPVGGVPTFFDACGPDNEQFTPPVDTETVDWEFVREGDTITVTATAKPGSAFEPGAQIKWTFVVRDADCVAPSLAGTLAAGVCEADAPWITYDVVLTDPDNQSTGTAATLVLSDGTNTERIELGELDDDGTLEGRTLWPGASVDDDGNATGWPGWEFVDGAWVETDGNFAWTRELTSAVIEVNPNTTVALVYPPATPNCVAGPPTGPGGEPGDGDGNTPSAGAGLAATGFAGTSMAIVAGVIVIAGIAFLVIARLRRKGA